LWTRDSDEFGEGFEISGPPGRYFGVDDVLEGRNGNRHAETVTPTCNTELNDLAA
jgi:hypothetical protein